MKQFIKGEFDAQDKLNQNFEEINASLSEKAQQLLQFSNPNLLINGDFQVWQRGTTFNITSYTYTADRVVANPGRATTISKVDSGLQIVYTDNNITCDGAIVYKMEDKLKIIGKKITISLKIDGVIYIYTGIFTDMTCGVQFNLDTKTFIAINWAQSDFGVIRVGHPNAPINTAHIINWWKLELGSIATPFVPRLYAEELALCQRYFERIGTSQSALLGNVGYAPAGTIKLRTVLVYERKRTFPTIKFSDLSQYRVYYDNTGSAGTTASLVTALNASDIHNDILTLSIVPTAPYGTSAYFQLQRIDGATSAWIDIDSEIY